MYLENRWFTKTGKAKRIPANLEQWRAWAIRNQGNILNGSVLNLTKSIKEDYNLGLADAANLMVYLIGCYSNCNRFTHINGGMFRLERYLLGEKVAKSFSPQDRPFNIRKLELV